LDFLGRGDGVRRPSCKVIRQAQQLGGFAVIWVLLERLLKARHGLQIVAFLVVHDSQLMREFLGIGLFRSQRFKLRQGFVEFALLR
jgi:hypothetical protein